MKTNTQKFMEEQGFTDIGTGGGCYGWFIKKGKFTYYMTVYSELTLPEEGDSVSVGAFDKEFEHQYLTMDVKKFDPKKAMDYIQRIEEVMGSKETKDRIKENPDEIIYI